MIKIKGNVCTGLILTTIYKINMVKKNNKYQTIGIESYNFNAEKEKRFYRYLSMKTMKKKEEQGCLRPLLIAIVLVLAATIWYQISYQSEEKKEPETRQLVNPDGSLKFEAVQRLAPDYIDSLKRAGEIERWLKEHPQQNINIHITIEDERW